MDLFECAVCMTDMVNRSPRCLLCLHSFCTPCLSKLNKGGAIQCPTCREITKLKTNDVKELKVDFRLLQMKEREQQTTSKDPGIPKNHCQICHVKNPLVKCMQCSQLLCVQCKIKHDNIGAFRSHQVAELCMKHQDGITHLCKYCIIPLCTKCILLDHSEHQEHFLQFDEGKRMLQRHGEEMHRDIRSSIQNMKQMHGDNKETRNHFRSVKQKLRQNQENLNKKLDEVNKCIIETDEKEKEFDKLCEQKAELEAEGELAAASLERLEINTSGFCQKYSNIQEKATQTLEKIKKVSPYKPLSYQVLDPCKCQIVKHISVSVQSVKFQPEPVRNLKLDKLMFNIHISSQKMCLGDHGALVVTIAKKPSVIEVNETGDVVNTYYPVQGGDIRAVARYGDNIYIAQSEAISVVPISQYKKPGNVVILNPYVKDILQILVKDNKTIIVFNKCNIYAYDMVKDQTKVLVQNLKQPSYMAMVHTDRGIQYYVTEWDAHKVTVFDESWRKVRQIGEQGKGEGQFIFPKGIAVTEMNTLLIADSSNYRISHYTADGRFLSQIVTHGDGSGLKLPCGIAYRKPYLWVCSNTIDSCYIKCFKLK